MHSCDWQKAIMFWQRSNSESMIFSFIFTKAGPQPPKIFSISIIIATSAIVTTDCKTLHDRGMKLQGSYPSFHSLSSCIPSQSPHEPAPLPFPHAPTTYTHEFLPRCPNPLNPQFNSGLRGVQKLSTNFTARVQIPANYARKPDSFGLDAGVA